MSSYTVPPPTITEFASVLSEETDWYTFGTFMGVPTTELESISRNYRTEGVLRCLIEMYNFIESRGQPLSWEHIVKSLRNMKKNYLSNKIQSKYVTPFLQPSPSQCVIGEEVSTNEASIGNSSSQEQRSPQDNISVIGDSRVGKETTEAIAKEFTTLFDKFTLLTSNFNKAFKLSEVDMDELQDVIEVQCGLEPLSKEQSSVDAVLKRLRQHYSILNFHILTFLVENFLKKNKMLLKQMSDYTKAVKRFSSSAKMIHLVDLIKTEQITSGRCKVVKLKVQEFWTQFTMKKFEKVINEILETLYELASQISVGKGCICVSWVVPDLDIADLITPQPMEFLKIIGVISLHVGDVLVYDVPGEGPDTLEAAMLQAVHLKNKRAIELLLSVGADPQLLATSKDDKIKNISFTSDSDESPYAEEQICEEVDFIEKEEEMVRVSDSGDFGLDEHLHDKDDLNETDTVEEQGNDNETNTVLKPHLDDEEPQILSTMLPDRLYQKEEAETEEGTEVNQREDETEEGTRVDLRDDEKQVANKSLKDDFTISLWFEQVGHVVRADRTISEPSLVLEDHDIKIQILKKYWSQDSSQVLSCCLAAGLKDEGLRKSGGPNEGFVLISPMFHLSCNSEQPVEVLLTVPHSLVTPSDVLKKMAIFTSPGRMLSSSTLLKFNHLWIPHWTVEDHYAMFITTLHKSSYFVMGLASSTRDVSPLPPLPVVPLQCSLYVDYPADLNYYITGTHIYVYVTLNLKTVELYMKRQETKDRKIERIDFILSEPKATVDSNNSPPDWLSLRKGDGVCQYTKIAYGKDSAPHKDPTTTFVVQCLNPNEPLKFGVSVTSGGYELAELSITPTNLLSKADLTRTLVPADVSPTHSALTSIQDKPEILEDNKDNKKQSSSEPNKDYKSKMIILYNESKMEIEYYEKGKTLTRNSSSLVCEDYPGIEMEITSDYWSQYPFDKVSCQLGVPDELDCIWPSGYLFISLPTYLSCKTKRPIDAKITLPQSLATSSEDHSENIEIFASTVSACVNRFLDVDMIINSNYSIQQFIPVKKSDLTMDYDKISFTTTVSAPSLYVVGVPSSIVGVTPTPLPAVPLQCVISMDYSDDLNDYLRGDYIEVKISMDLRMEEKYMLMGMRSDFFMRGRCFTLSGPVCTVNGTVETSSSSGWQSVRAKKGSFHYDEIAISEKWNKKRCDNPPRVQTRFFVKCFDPKTPLKFRVTVLCHNNNELVNLLLTPLDPAAKVKTDEDTDTDTDKD